MDVSVLYALKRIIKDGADSRCPLDVMWIGYRDYLLLGVRARDLRS
jgi:hypothetical protein